MNSPCANHDALGGQADISVKALDLLIDDVKFYKEKSHHLFMAHRKAENEVKNLFLSFLEYFPAAFSWADIFAGVEALQNQTSRVYPLVDMRKEKTE
jgi:hypothetical protein